MINHKAITKASVTAVATLTLRKFLVAHRGSPGQEQAVSRGSLGDPVNTALLLASHTDVRSTESV